MLVHGNFDGGSHSQGWQFSPSKWSDASRVVTMIPGNGFTKQRNKNCWTILFGPTTREKQNFTSFSIGRNETVHQENKIFLMRFLFRCFFVYKSVLRRTNFKRVYKKQKTRDPNVNLWIHSQILLLNGVFYQNPRAI